MNTRIISRMAVALFLTAGAAALGPTGCSPSSSSVCNKLCDCTGCSDKERDECVDTFDDARKAAEDEGCGDQYDEYFSCADSEITCHDGTVDADGCESEGEELGKCLSGSNLPGGVNNRCQAAADAMIAKYESCGLDVQQTGGQKPECTTALAEQAECYNACVQAAGCEAFTQASNEFTSCIGSC